MCPKVIHPAFPDVTRTVADNQVAAWEEAGWILAEETSRQEKKVSAPTRRRKSVAKGASGTRKKG